MAGGLPGATGANWVERLDGKVEALPHIGQAEMAPGDIFAIRTPGGGGYGKPASPKRPGLIKISRPV
jgi:5-oxoprolinase (ATP-hydrolysing)